MAETINIATISVDVNAFITEAKKAKDELDKLTKANKELKASTTASTEEIIENEIAIKKAREAYNQNVNSAKALQLATKDLTNTIETEGKSVQQVIQDRNKLIALSKNIKGSTEEEIALRNKLNTAIDSQTEFIRKNQSQYSASKDMIGEYKQALSTLSPQLSSVVDKLGAYRGAFDTVRNSIKGQISTQKEKIEADKAMAVSQGVLSKSIIGVNGALKLFRLALISTGIGAIVVVLGSLITYLTSTQEGIDKINAVLTPMKVIFQSLLGVIQNVGKSLFEAFSKPKVLLNDLVNFIKTNLINRFKAFAVIIDGIANLDFKKITNGALQLSTGVENLTDKIQKAGEKAKATYDEALNRGKQIAKLDVEISKGKNQLILDEAKLRNEIKKGNQLAENASLSAKEREQGAIASIEASKKLLALQQALNSKEIERAQLKAKSNDTDREGQGEINELIAKQNDLETAQLELITTQTTKLNSIRKESASQAKQLSDQARQRQDEAFRQSQQQLNEELELFLTNQGIKAKTLAEEVVIAQEVATKKQIILDNELQAGKISQEKYQTETLKIAQELAGKQAELAVENAFNQAEIQRQQIEQTILNEQEKNAKLLEIEKQYQAERLAQGVISQTEYNNVINELNEQNRLANIELEKERAAIDKENQLASEVLSFEEAQQRRRDELEQRKELELEQANITGADKNLIEAKYSKENADLERELVNQKLAIALNGLNSLSEALGKQSKAGKAIALAQALINTYQGITAELATKTVTPFEFGLKLANIASVTAIGFKAVKNITSTQTPKAERGAMIGGLPHAQGGTLIEAERGEAIINKNSVSRFKPLLSAINQAGGGVSFGATSQTQSDLINYDAIGRQFRSALVDMPSPVVAVEEIKDVTRKYTKVVERASI